ncbi:hypothetical protein CPB84DRAFT_1750390 [Gymnopilus junonius]|uniref:Zinc finger PHD-type domain-containing protein n=1 Tax=Gymnopilus junonius TaxID=109634 RepID=A0A9P5NFI5_GYMJU|nr:hypothetical protein CPB84DRAFT_1750390 [Gymnopilus junonius]
MVGNDANLDMLQLVSRLSGTTEVSNILAKYPQWDHAPQCLKLPALTCKSEAIPDHADHIKPASWRGNVKDCDFLKSVLAELDKNQDITILAPSGTILFDVPLADDDIDKSLEFPSPPPSVPDDEAAETRVEVEDALEEIAAAENEASTLLRHRVIEKDVLGMRPATVDDDPDNQNDWRTYCMEEKSFTIPGKLVQPINPTISRTHTGLPWYLFQGTFLVALAASVFQQMSFSALKNIPKLAPNKDYPYRQASGAACFICSEDSQVVDIRSGDCPRCSPTVTLDLTQGQRVLEHMGAHILHDPSFDDQQLSPLCQFFLKKGKGANGRLGINAALSKGCHMKLLPHVQTAHPMSALSQNRSCNLALLSANTLPREASNAPLLKYDNLWKLSDFETSEMKKIWAKRQVIMVTRTRKPKNPFCDETRMVDNHDLEHELSDSDDDELQDQLPTDESDLDPDGETDVDLERDTSGFWEPEETSGFWEPVDMQQENEVDVGREENVGVSVSVSNSEDVEMIDSLADSERTENEATGIGLETNEPETNDANSKIMDTSTDAPVEELGRFKRKKFPRQQVQEGEALNICLCGEVVDHSLSERDPLIKCKQATCVTQWFHLRCGPKTEIAPRNWICDVCAPETRRAAKRLRK